MDITAIEGQELTAVEFISDYLRLRFDGPAPSPRPRSKNWKH
jgi:hypothetical protein